MTTRLGLLVVASCQSVLSSNVHMITLPTNPNQHMRHLHGLFTASSGPVTLHTIANGSHNDTFIVGGKRYFSGISEFLSKVHIRKDTMIHEKSD